MGRQRGKAAAFWLLGRSGVAVTSNKAYFVVLAGSQNLLPPGHDEAVTVLFIVKDSANKLARDSKHSYRSRATGQTS